MQFALLGLHSMGDMHAIVRDAGWGQRDCALCCRQALPPRLAAAVGGRACLLLLNSITGKDYQVKEEGCNYLDLYVLL